MAIHSLRSFRRWRRSHKVLVLAALLVSPALLILPKLFLSPAPVSPSVSSIVHPSQDQDPSSVGLPLSFKLTTGQPDQFVCYLCYSPGDECFSTPSYVLFVHWVGHARAGWYPISG